MNLTVSKQMVFADRGEIISGGNFHGEYPAKVSTIRLEHLKKDYAKYKKNPRVNIYIFKTFLFMF